MFVAMIVVFFITKSIMEEIAFGEHSPGGKVLK